MIAHAAALPPVAAHDAPHRGATLVALDGRALPLRAAALSARAASGLGRATLVQTFVNDHAEPLHVEYQVPLPADGAVSGYRFVIGERTIEGRIDRRGDARRAFEDAILSGRTAALLEQDRTSLFHQEIGNVPAGATVTITLTIDQPLVWSAERGGCWEWRFPTVVAPRYMGEAGRVPDAGRIAPHVTLDPMPLGTALRLDIDESTLGVESPSHAIRSIVAASTTVELADGTAPLDRDIVVRWAVASQATTSSLSLARTGGDTHALLTLVPPRVDQPARSPHVARDLIVLLDTSGSMSGAPLEQSKRVAMALVDRLDDRDRLELIEFSTSPRAWRASPVAADAAARTAAKAWIAELRASGGTEMRTGIHAALCNLRPEAQRQVVLVTDGQIGFESEIVGRIHAALPSGCRVHTVGVGSGVNRSLTSPAARAGRGVEIVIGINEDPERAVAKLLAHTGAPQIVDLQLDGDALLEHAPQHLPDLMAGMPAQISLRLRPSGGTLRIHGRTATGIWEQRIAVPRCVEGTGNAGVVARFGRQRVEDLEMRVATGERGLDPQIEALGLDYAISTRLTSWVAVDAEVRVDPTEPTRREVMPHALPHGMSASGVGLRAPAGAMPQGDLGTLSMEGAPSRRAAAAPSRARTSAPAEPEARKTQQSDGLIARAVRRLRPGAPPQPAAPAPAPPPAMRDEAGGSADADRMAEAEAPGERTMRTTAGFAAPAPVLRKGTFTRTSDGAVVIELEITDEAIDWIPPSTLELFVDHTPASAAIDPSRTTRAGRIVPGTRIRICCLGVPAGNVAHARCFIGGVLVLVHA